ncbi:MAG: hypothetical protein AAF387_14215 [Pseudomonadota bacterium]
MKTRIKVKSIVSVFILFLGYCATSSAAIIASDDFDGGALNRASYSATPNNAFNTPFPTNNNDVFGIINRTINGRFRDNSASSGDNFGILDSTKTDNVFGVQDLRNGSNPGGTGTATWVFDINNATGLSLDIDMAAMGNFEDSGNGADFFNFSISIDGAPATQIITIVTDESTTQDYLLEGFGSPRTIADPLVANGTALSNLFQTISVDLSSFGTGSQLTLSFFANNNGNEVFAFDNIVVNGTPVPLSPSMWLLGSGLFVLGLKRR